MFDIRFGKYILFQLTGPVKQLETSSDDNIKVVREYDRAFERNFGITRATAEERLGEGDIFLVYFDGSVPAGMMWGHRGGCYVRGSGIPIVQDRDAVYWYWIYTAPQSRGKNIYKKLRNTFFRCYADATKFSALVKTGNNVMKNEMRKLGFAEEKRFASFRLGNVSLLYVRHCNGSRETDVDIEIGNRYGLPVI